MTETIPPVNSISSPEIFTLTTPLILPWKDNNPREWYTYASNGSKYFQGSFDGDGHTVSGIYYKGSERIVGLIPAAKGSVTVKNLHVADSYIESSNYGLAAAVGLYGRRRF